MGNKRISELQIEVNPQISDLIALASNGTSKRTTLGSITNAGLPATFGDTIINGDITVNGTETIVSSSVLYDSGSTIFGNSSDDRHEFTGSVHITGITELGGNLIPLIAKGATLGTLERPFSEIFLQSGSISIESDTPGDPSAIISNKEGNLEISVGGMLLVQPGASFVAPTGSFEYLSGSFNHIGSAFRQGNTIVTGSFAVSGSTVQIGDNTLDGLTKLRGNVSVIGNTTIEGTTTFSDSATTVTGSFLISGSTTQIGNNTLKGNTILSGSVNIIGNTTIEGTTTFSDSSTTVTGSFLISGSTTQIGDNTLDGNTILSGSVNIIGNTDIKGTTTFSDSATTVTGSFLISGSTTQIGNNTLDGNTILSGSVNIIGSTTIEGTTNFSNSSTTVTGSFLVSGSTTQIGNNTLDGNTILSGSVDISGSTEFNGDVDVIGDFYHLGNKQYNYGQFYSLETQSGSADTPYEMKFEGADSTNGISIGDNGSGLPTRITPNHTGLYNIQFSNQLGNTANSDVTFDIWFRQNGTNVTNSNTKFSLLKSLGSGLYTAAALNFMANINAGDYVEIMWSTDKATGQFEYLGTQTSPTRPATPSIILTVTQIA